MAHYNPKKKKKKGTGIGGKGLECKICDMRFDNFHNYNKHMESPRHVKNERLRQAGQMTPVTIKEGKATTASDSGFGGFLTLAVIVGAVIGFLWWAKKSDQQAEPTV